MSHMSIQQARKKLRLSQNKLAQRCGMHPSSISLIESGRLKPSAETAARIAKALGISIEDLRDAGQQAGGAQ